MFENTIHLFYLQIHVGVLLSFFHFSINNMFILRLFTEKLSKLSLKALRKNGLNE